MCELLSSVSMFVQESWLSTFSKFWKCNKVANVTEIMSLLEQVCILFSTVFVILHLGSSLVYSVTTFKIRIECIMKLFE